MTKLSSHLKWSFINAIGSLIIKIGSLVLVSWLIDPAVFGIYSIGLAIVLIVTTLVQIGIPTSIVTSADDYNYIEEAIFLLFLSVVSCLLLIHLTSYYIENIYFHELYLFFSLLIILQVVINTLEALCKKNYKFKQIGISELASSAIGSCLVTLCLAVMQFKIYSLLIGQIVYCITKIILLYQYFPFKVNFKNITRKKLKEITSGSMSITVAELCNIALIQIQRPIIGFKIGAAAAGIWSRVYQIILIQLTVVVQPVDYLTLPMLAKLKNDSEYLERIVLALLQIISFFSLFCVVLTICLASLLIPILLGPKWVDLVVPLQIGALIIFFRAIERLLISISRALGMMKFRAAIQVFQLFLVATSLLIFSEYGLIFASWVLLFSLFACLLVSILTTKTTINISAFLIVKCLIPGFIIFSLPCLLFIMLLHVLHINYFITLISVFALLFILVLFLWWKKHLFFEQITIDSVEKIRKMFLNKSLRN